MTHHRIAQIAENGNPKSPETRAQTCRFLQIRLLQPSRSAAPLNGSAVLHGRLRLQALISAAWDKMPELHFSQLFDITGNQLVPLDGNAFQPLMTFLQGVAAL
jgi:hypothetical protein